ncbi:VOC family protein [Micromonospora sagamiensis]|uniref:Putative glyoxalase superfamily protein PhnB n=1 Tax=Micromonospora sagamiensis TaxID=47875 RepID=A0A562WI92_9ACTN|nr:VOC family protein [Micromonospora sagamiensis]TWJ29868.1 putative glyoxalase superfamily protein PhnB [Micromonospora sagamiensis]BCL17103.1 glyoxalase [Micromonospora sagamiensis]
MTPRFDLVGMVATDLPRTLDFYRRLGVDVPAGAEHEPHVEVALPGGLRLAWDTVETIRSFDPDWQPGSGGPRVSLAFRCADPAEVDRYYAELTGAGFAGHRPPWDAFWGQRYAVLHDPEGNGVDLYAPLPERPSPPG